MRAFFLGKNPVSWLARTIRTKGLRRVIAVAWQSALDMAWDWSHGTETLKRIPPRELQTESENKANATDYGATRARPLSRLLQQLNLPRSGGFVDLGCGKGRVLIIAAEQGFQRITGVDFSGPLCDIARRNLDAFQQRQRIKAEVTILHSDVVGYNVRGDDNVFFLYDPFQASVLDEVIENLRRSLAAHPRKLWMIYNSPRLHTVMQKSGLFPVCRYFEIGGNEFSVYETEG